MIASLTPLKELMFFISTLVPNSVSPSFIKETLTSHLICPLSLRAYEVSQYKNILLSASKKATASSAELRQGSVTVSNKGTPHLL